MIPTLFSESFSGTITKHGAVDLIDCIECFAEQTEDDGSEWELMFSYPIGGEGFDQIVYNALVLAKANDHQDPQLFRIYSIEKRIGKTVAVSAQHISYDMANFPVKTFKATSASDAVNKMLSNVVATSTMPNRFTVTTNISSSDAFEPDTPVSMRAMLLDGDTSIKGTYGGDVVFNNYSVRLNSVGGADRGVTIEYGIDLIDMSQEENISEMVTGILPYYKRSTTDDLYETSPIIYGSVTNGPGTYRTPKIIPVDLTEHFPNNIPTVAQLNAKAAEWVANEEIGTPEVSLTVSYANLGDKDVRILDAVRVKFPALNVDVKAKVVKYRYNVLLERCEEIEVGHAKDSRYFDLMDASRLRKGLIPPERIQNESITDSKIAKGGVGVGKIGKRAIGNENIQLGAIDHGLLSRKGAGGGGAAVQGDNIADDAVGSEEIADSAVTTAAIAPLAVTSGKVGTSAITTVKMADAAVAYAKLTASLKSEVDKIDVLESQIAYINKLFATSAQIDFIRAHNMYADTQISCPYINASGTLAVNAGGLYYGGYKLVWTTIDGTPVLTR